MQKQTKYSVVTCVVQYCDVKIQDDFLTAVRIKLQMLNVVFELRSLNWSNYYSSYRGC